MITNLSDIGPLFLNIMQRAAESSLEAPKAVYYSSTRKTLYIMLSHYNTADHFEVVTFTQDDVDNLGDTYSRVIEDRFQVRNEPYKEMTESISKFFEFVEAHINRKHDKLKELSY